jgi:hypothetical protein
MLLLSMLMGVLMLYGTVKEYERDWKKGGKL